MENLIIFTVFVLSIAYLVRLVKKSLSGEKTCSANCGGACSKIPDFNPEN